jgi:hypothetical protein
MRKAMANRLDGSVFFFPSVMIYLSQQDSVKVL